MAASIAVVGSVNVDLVATVESLPGPGETVTGPGVTRHGGGKGANVATACARLGAATEFVGAVGDDDFGTQARAQLEADGVGVSELRTLAGVATGTAMIAVDARGENQIVVGLGANQALTPAQVEESLARLIGEVDCVVVGTEIADECVTSAVALAAEAEAEAGVRCVLVPAPARASLLEAMEHRPLITPNEGEAELLARALGASWDSRDALASTLAGAAGLIVVMTRGAHGAVVAEPGRAPVPVTAPKVDVVDTTGAGDAFAGALAVRLAAGDVPAIAARYAVAAAALSVSHAGARAGMPRAGAVEAAQRGA